MHVIKEPKALSFNKAGVKGKIFPITSLITSTQYFLIDTKRGHKTKIIEHECDFIYYVLEGSGYFEINNNKETCSVGDLVVIPKGSKFTYKGKLKMIATSTPPWREEQEETL